MKWGEKKSREEEEEVRFEKVGRRKTDVFLSIFHSKHLGQRKTDINVFESEWWNKFAPLPSECSWNNLLFAKHTNLRLFPKFDFQKFKKKNANKREK